MSSPDAYRPTLHRFTLGQADVTTILDGAHIREPINPPFAMDKSEGEIAAIAHTNNLPTNWVRKHLHADGHHRWWEDGSV